MILLLMVMVTWFIPSIAFTPFSEPISLSIAYTSEDDAHIASLIELYTNGHSRKLGTARIFYTKHCNTGYIQELVIAADQRGKKYGSILLQCALDTLFKMNAQKVILTAHPIELKPGQTPESMLPQLLKFYEKNGGHVVLHDERVSSAAVIFHRPPSSFTFCQPASKG